MPTPADRPDDLPRTSAASPLRYRRVLLKLSGEGFSATGSSASTTPS